MSDELRTAKTISKQIYHSAAQYLHDALVLLDLRLRRMILIERIGRGDEGVQDPARGWMVSDTEVERLFQRPQEHSAQKEITKLEGVIADWEVTLASNAEAAMAAGIHIPLMHVASVFGLSSLEEQILMLALAPNLNRKYERIYGYLQDDVNKHSVSLDLVARCLGASELQRQEIRSACRTDSALFKYLLELPDENLPGWAAPLRVAPRLVQFLTASYFDSEAFEPVQVIDTNNLPEILVQRNVQRRLTGFIDRRSDIQAIAGRSVYFHIQGLSGAGKKFQVLHFCRTFGVSLVMYDLRELPAERTGFIQTLRRIITEAVLQKGIIGLQHVDHVCQSHEYNWRCRELFKELKAYKGIVFLLSQEAVNIPELARQDVLIKVEIPMPASMERELLWRTWFEDVTLNAEVDLSEIAAKFLLTPGQIEAAVRQAKAFSVWRTETGDVRVTVEDIHQACYQQAAHRLDERAVKILPRFGFEDLVLPAEQVMLLRNACNHMRYRSIVYEGWGFSQRIAYGRGISLLFSGPPGTGKTMAVEVIGRELGMHIYKIDLAQVVSKYVGETEKNLREVFREADRSQAILFFDEADALFGKRSEVKDAHDKYANVETAFLLQQMEQYEGISVLATNLYQNIDEAFIRRLTYVVKFPFPDETDREQIWRSMLPKDAPVSNDVDFDFLARKFKVSGGVIKNIVLAAGFLAAGGSGSIGMRELLLAARDELNKSGNLFVTENLGPYAHLVRN